MKAKQIQVTRRNFLAFLWHALFLALAINFSDVNTIIPTMLIRAGGTTIHLGILTAIMIGGTGFMQLFFAAFLANKPNKKPFLLTGIYLRVTALLSLGLLLTGAKSLPGALVIGAIFLLISLFSFSGSFAGISYNDILGKSIEREERKRFFVLKQTIASSGILVSALLVRYLVKSIPYPANYSSLFITAGILLSVASLGFWAIRERPTRLIPDTASPHHSNPQSRRNGKSILSSYIEILKGDRNMVYYLLLINAAGLGLTLVPFYISLAKSNFQITGRDVGNYLLLQIVGMILSNFLWHRLVKRGSYKLVIVVYSLLAAVIPFVALFLSRYQNYYPLLFLLTGANASAYKIAIPGIFLEISREHNRVLYTALSGAGSLSNIIFPLAGGILISRFGYLPVFAFSILIILCGILLVKQLDCRYQSEEEFQV